MLRVLGLVRRRQARRRLEGRIEFLLANFAHYYFVSCWQKKPRGRSMKAASSSRTCNTAAADKEDHEPKPGSSPATLEEGKAQSIFDAAILPCSKDRPPCAMSLSSWRWWVLPCVGQRRGPHKFGKGHPVFTAQLCPRSCIIFITSAS